MRRPVWITVMQEGCGLRLPDGRVLAVTVIRDPKTKLFACLALEMPNGTKTTRRILDFHSHAVIGERFATAAKAKAAGEKYMRSWAKKNGAADLCGCRSIGEKKRAA